MKNFACILVFLLVCFCNVFTQAYTVSTDTSLGTDRVNSTTATTVCADAGVFYKVGGNPVGTSPPVNALKGIETPGHLYVLDKNHTVYHYNNICWSVTTATNIVEIGLFQGSIILISENGTAYGVSNTDSSGNTWVVKGQMESSSYPISHCLITDEKITVFRGMESRTVEEGFSNQNPPSDTILFTKTEIPTTHSYVSGAYEFNGDIFYTFLGSPAGYTMGGQYLGKYSNGSLTILAQLGQGAFIARLTTEEILLISTGTMGITPYNSNNISNNGVYIPLTSATNIYSYNYVEGTLTVLGRNLYGEVVEVERIGEDSFALTINPTNPNGIQLTLSGTGYGPYHNPVRVEITPSTATAVTVGVNPKPFVFAGNPGPNPGVNVFSEGTIEITNMSGQILKSFAVQYGDRILTEDFASGVYMVRFQNPNDASASTTLKMVKQ